MRGERPSQNARALSGLCAYPRAGVAEITASGPQNYVVVARVAKGRRCGGGERVETDVTQIVPAPPP